MRYNLESNGFESWSVPFFKKMHHTTTIANHANELPDYVVSEGHKGDPPGLKLDIDDGW